MRKKGQILRQQAKTAAVIALVAICTSIIAKELIKAIIDWTSYHIPLFELTTASI
jgi:hypothetical protein